MSTATDSRFAGQEVKRSLFHHGVKGQRWGVIRRKTSSGYVPISEDAMKARIASSKPAHALSNNEMQALITRMNLERQYSSLVNQAPPPNVASKAAKFVGSLLADIGKQEVTRLAKGAVSMKVEDALKAKGKADLAKRIAPKKK